MAPQNCTTRAWMRLVSPIPEDGRTRYSYANNGPHPLMRFKPKRRRGVEIKMSAVCVKWGLEGNKILMRRAA